MVLEVLLPKMLASHKPNTKVGFKTKFTTPKPFNFATENRAVARAGSGMQRFRNLQELSASEKLASHNPHKGIASNVTITKPFTFTTAERALKRATIANNSNNVQELSASEKLASHKPHKDISSKASNVTVTKPFTFTTAERARRRTTTANNYTNVQNGQEGADSSLRSGAKGKSGRGGYSARPHLYFTSLTGTRKERNSQLPQIIAAQSGTCDNTSVISRTVKQLSSLSSVDFDVPNSVQQEVEASETQSVTMQQQHLRVQDPERLCLSFSHVGTGFELDTYHSNDPFVKDSCTPTSEFSQEIVDNFLKFFSRSAATCDLLMTVFGKVPTQISLPSQRLEECCVDPNMDTVQKYHIPAYNPRAPTIRLSSTSVSLQMSVAGNHHKSAGNLLPQNAETRHGITMLSRYVEPLFESTVAWELKRTDERVLVVDLKGCFMKIGLSLSNTFNGTIVPSSLKESWGSCFWNLEISVEMLHEDSRSVEVCFEAQQLWEIFNRALLPQGSASLVINKFCLSYGEISNTSSACSHIKRAGTRKERNSQLPQIIAAQSGTCDNTSVISRTVKQLSSLSSVDFDVPNSVQQEVEASETQSVTMQQQHLRVQDPERLCLSFSHVGTGFKLDTYHSNDPFVKDSCTPTSEFSQEIVDNFLKFFSRSAATCDLLMTVFGKVPTQISLPSQRLEECCVDPNMDTVQKYHIPAYNPRAPTIRLSSTPVSLQMSVAGNHHKSAGNLLPQNAETRHGITMLSRYVEPLFESTVAWELKRTDERVLVVDLKGCFMKIGLSLSNTFNGTIVPSSLKESWGSCFWNLEISVEMLHEDSRSVEVCFEAQQLWEIFNRALLPQGSASLVINKFCLSYGEISNTSSACSHIKRGVNGQRTNGYSYDGCAPQSDSQDPCCHFEVYRQSPARLLPISEPVPRHPVTEIHLSHMPYKSYFNSPHASERSLRKIIDHSDVRDQYHINRGFNEPEQFLALPSRHASVLAKGPDLAHETCFGQDKVMVMQLASLADQIVAEDKRGQSLTDSWDETGDSGIQKFENDSPCATTKLSPLFEQLHAINIKHHNIKFAAADSQCGRFEKAKHFEEIHVKMVDASSATPSCKGTLNSGKKRGIEINCQELSSHLAKLDISHQKGSLTPHTGNQAHAKGSYTPYTGKETNSYKNHTVFIRGFDKSLHVDQIRSSLKEHFGFCGEIIRVSIPLVPETGYPKGFAFMVFKDEDSFDLALELNGIYLGGRALYVDQARLEIDRGEGRGRGGGDHHGRGSFDRRVFDRGGHGGRGRFLW